MHYSVQPTYLIFVKSYGFLSFSKNTGKKIDKDIGKRLSGKYSKKFLDYTKQSATNARIKNYFKTSNSKRQLVI